ncbi:DUF2946 family protein [Altererythrobacter lauratis]|uniref:DUF2946 family protein n=1 Tax=Alteraurantiacibacter lauratis TaxID=2054627 RepID=A0ABV7EGE3_9SPHN
MALALAAKALIPAGFMLASAPDRLLTVTICSGLADGPKQMQILVPGKQDDRRDLADTQKAQACAFAGLGHAALGGADPLLLAAALTFILLIGLAPRSARLSRKDAFLRPPLRGPPALSV